MVERVKDLRGKRKKGNELRKKEMEVPAGKEGRGASDPRIEKNASSQKKRRNHLNNSEDGTKRKYE